MAAFPKSDKEIEALTAFLSSGQTVDPRKIKLAERLRARLQSPVRVALVGAKDAGKSTLSRLLVGRELILPTKAGAVTPSSIAVYGQTQTLVAGWWDGRRKAFDNKAVRLALAEKPDYVEFAYPLQILERISFFDMPSAPDPEDQKRRLAWLFKRADLVLWCKRAGEEWKDTEEELWAQAPESLQASSILAVTNVNKLNYTSAQKSLARLADRVGDKFTKILPIATLEAAAAAPGGTVRDAAAWKASGGALLVTTLIKTARTILETHVTAAHTFMEEQGITTAEEVVAAPKKVKTEPAPPPEEPKKIITGADLRARVEKLLQDLTDVIQGDAELNSAKFIETCATASEEIEDMLAVDGLVDPSAAWLIFEVSHMKDYVLELVEEPTEEGVQDVASMLLQLSRDISWSVAA